MTVALVAIGLALSAIALARWWLGRRWLVVTVHGASMAPTLRDGERLLVPRPARGEPPACVTGDIVVFTMASPQLAIHPGDPDHRVKRIAAVAGEMVPSWARAALGASEHTHVPPGCVVVTGDNVRSQDSRQLGYIAVGAIIAVVPPRPPSPGASRAIAGAP